MNYNRQEIKQGEILYETLVHSFQQMSDQNEILDYISKSLLDIINPNILEKEKITRIQVMIHLFLNSSMEKNLKKGALKRITDLPQKWHSQILIEMSCYVNETSKVLNDYDNIPVFFENIVVLLTNTVTATEIFNFKFLHIALLYENLIKNLYAQLRHETIKIKEIKFVQLLHFLMQTLIVFVDESCKHKTSINFPHSLYEAVRDMMACKKLCINTINNCGLLLVTLDRDFFDLSSSLEILKSSSQSSPIECLAMCHGILINSSSINSLNSNSVDGRLLILIFDAIRSIYVNNMNDNLVVIEILKIILLIAKKIVMKKLNTFSNTLQDHVKYLVDLLLSQLDHFVNPIKNLSKEALKHFILQKDESIILEVVTFLESTRRVDRKTCTILTSLSSVVPFSQILSSYQTVISDLRHASKNSVSSNYVCQAYLSLMISDYDDAGIDTWYNVWMKPLLRESDCYNLLLEQILVPAVKLSPFISQKIIRFCRCVNETNYALIVKYLLQIKSIDLSLNVELSDFSDMNLNKVYWKNLLPLELMKRVICISSSVNALKTADLLIENLKGKEMLTSEEISLLKLFIDSQMAPKQSDFRHKFLNLLKQLFIKISKNYDSSYADLLEWTTSHCVNNLFPGASYERRYTALRILQIMVEANVWLSSKTNARCLEILLQCINDPFEENKEIAKNIIIAKFMQRKEMKNDDLRMNLFWESVSMAAGRRFSEHDSAAFLLEILCHATFSQTYFTRITVVMNLPFTYDDDGSGDSRVEDSYLFYLKVLVSSLEIRLHGMEEKFMIQYPLHGFLRIIRHLLKYVLSKNQYEIGTERWKILINKIIQISLSSNEFVVGIVSHSSPEGYLPDEETYDELTDDTHCIAQQLLLCSWRTTKEASLLLGDVVENCSININDNENACLNKNVFLQIGNHLRILIYKIRHKGSFKQVYMALFKFCRRCWSIFDRDISELPKRWLAEVVKEVTNNDQQLCLTRRGAGVPCIVLAILCTEPNGKRKYASNLLKKFMEDMFGILNDRDIAPESKVHAMNIFCELFKHKDMSEEIDVFIERAIVVSINGCESAFWSERNTSNLLLSSILTRTFGVSRSRNEISWKNKMTGKMFFQKYPALFDVFLFHLQQDKDERVGVQSALYPILLIFARLYPSHHDEWNVTFQLNAFIPFIYNCCQSSVFKIRELAVQAIIPLITPDIYVEHINKIWFHLMLPFPENTKHGLLLQLHGLLLNELEFDENHDERLLLIFVQILLEAEFFFQENHSFVVKEKLLVILSTILRKCHARLDLAKMKNYPINENYLPKVDDNYLHEQNYSKAVRTFNIGLLYLVSVKNREEKELIRRLESMIERRSIEITTNIVLEFIIKIISDEELENVNVILQHLIPDDENKKATKKLILESIAIQNYILTQLIDSNNNCLYPTMFILPDVLQNLVDTESAVEAFSNFCEKHHNNSRLMTPFLKSADILLQKLGSWEEKCLSVLKFILIRSRNPCLEYQRSLRKFCFKYFNHSFLKVHEDLVLNIWTYVIEKISTIEEDEFVYFEGLFHDFDAEEHLLPKKVLQAFGDYLKSNLLLNVVGLFSWIIKDVGVVFNKYETNGIFLGDLPDYFEDQILVSKLCMELLINLLKQYPLLLHDKLSSSEKLWVLKQGVLNQEEFDVSTLFDIVSIILQKFESLKVHSSNTLFSRQETVEQRVISCKLSFLHSLISDCDL